MQDLLGSLLQGSIKEHLHIFGLKGLKLSGLSAGNKQQAESDKEYRPYCFQIISTILRMIVATLGAAALATAMISSTTAGAGASGS